MPDFNLTNTAADIDQALQDSVDLVSPLAANTNSTTAYGDNGNGVSAVEAAIAIKGAKDGNIGKNSSSVISDYNSIGACGYFSAPTGTANQPIAGNNTVINAVGQDQGKEFQISALTDAPSNPRVYYRVKQTVFGGFVESYHTGNTTVDGSGFIKQASPIIKLFADRIEKNILVGESVSLTKNSVGNYTITGSLGFAQEGWYIEQPKDANGQTKHFIEYQQDQDGTIHIQVYQPVYTNGGVSKGEPCDVVEGRWIDIRLHKELDNTGE